MRGSKRSRKITQKRGPAEPKLWTEIDKFRASASAMQDELGQVNTAAKSGNPDALKAAAGDAGKSCKSRHGAYRKE